MEEKTRLGRLLVEARLLTQEQLKMAIDFQKTVGGKLGAIIVKLGFIEDGTLIQFIAKQQGLKVVNLEEMVIPENLVKRVPRKLIDRHHILPIHYHNGVLTIATSDPYDFEAIEEVQMAQDAKVEIQLAPRSAIHKAMAELFDRDSAPAKPAAPPEAPKPDRHQLHDALIPLLIQKGVITEDELVKKARELGAAHHK